MIALTRRSAFLRGLLTLPMVGEGVSLIGSPSAVAAPVPDELMWGYKDWLLYEHRMLSHEIAGYDEEQARHVERLSHFCSPASYWHFRFPAWEGFRLAGWADTPFQPSTRAALVMSAVGCDWRPVRR